jgi:predicted lipoprotein with Yx(FWY)xxD motif
VTKIPTILVLPVVALAIAGCGGGTAKTSTTPSTTPSSTSSSSPSSTPAVQVSTMNLPGLGPVLVNGQGRTLYMFVPDGRRTVTCVSSCAAIWPPVKLSNGQRAVAAGQAKPSLLGSDPDPAGGRA